jgi:hypothetical protein
VITTSIPELNQLNRQQPVRNTVHFKVSLYGDIRPNVAAAVVAAAHKIRVARFSLVCTYTIPKTGEYIPNDHKILAKGQRLEIYTKGPQNT